MSRDSTPLSLFILAGEPSGDLHAGHLVAQLKKKHRDISIEGTAGPHMRDHGVTGPLAMEDFQVMGFTDVLMALPRLYSHFQKICSHILDTQPSGVVMVDYPGFNLRLAKKLRKNGYKGKLVHYISPSVWAHGKGRIDTMSQNLDLLLTIYPFEAAHFSHTPLPVEYVGNPLCNYIDEYAYDADWKTHVGIDGDESVIGIFPGSRTDEVRRNLPIIIEAAKKFLQNHSKTIFAVSCSSAKVEPIIRSIIEQLAPDNIGNFALVPKNWTYELMQACRCAIAKSGTVTLELALHAIPSVVVYKLTWLNKLIAKHFLRLNLPHYCIVNILSDNEIFPELIVDDPTAEVILSHIDTLFSNDIVRKQRIQACHILHKRLGTTNASAQAAEAIIRALL